MEIIPPLNKGQLVNLSFELEPKQTEEAGLDVPDSFEHLGEGEYRFCGTVLKVYEGDDQDTLVVIQTGDFRFYIISDKPGRYVQGRRSCGEGTLLLDHYRWVEFLDSYEDPPNLFYNFGVSRICRVHIPEKFVSRHENGKSLPTRLVTNDYCASDVEEMSTMEGQSFDEEFYIIEFDGSGFEGRDIPRTFIS